MNQTKQNSDTLFAFQMALKGHKQFELQSEVSGNWHKTSTVTSEKNHRIYHDISEGWTRHDNEDWKGDKDAVIEQIMYCDGTKGEITNISILRQENPNNFTAENPKYRIYAYKLAAKSPAMNLTEQAATVLQEIDASFIASSCTVSPKSLRIMRDFIADYLDDLQGAEEDGDKDTVRAIERRLTKAFTQWNSK